MDVEDKTELKFLLLFTRSLRKEEGKRRRDKHEKNQAVGRITAGGHRLMEVVSSSR